MNPGLPEKRDSPARPRRRWLQFSLRGLMLATTLVAILLGVWDRQIRRPLRSREFLSNAMGDYMVRVETEPWPWGWVEKWDDRYFRRAVDVRLYGHGATNYFSDENWSNCAPVHVFVGGYSEFPSTRVKPRGLGNREDTDLEALSDYVMRFAAQSKVAGAGGDSTKPFEGVLILGGGQRQEVRFHHDRATLLECLAAIGGLPRLRDLSLAGCRLRDEDLEILQDLSHLEALDLRDNPLHGSALFHVAALPRLERLGLSKTKVDAAGLAHLRRLERLEWLDLAETPITVESLAEVSGIRPLRNLCLARASITPDAIRELSAAPNLEVLDLSVADWPLQPTLEISGLARLKQLDLSHAQCSRDVELQIRDLPMLEALWLDNIHHSVRVRLSGVDNLRMIDLSYVDVDAGTLESLSNLPNLEVLYLDGTGFVDGERESAETLIGKLAGLTHLSLDRTSLSRLQLSALKRLESLTVSGGVWELNVDGLDQLVVVSAQDTDLASEAVRSIATCRNLLALDLSGNRLTDARVAELTGLARLERLYLADTLITDRSIDHLVKLRNLKVLRIDGTAISSDGVARLKRLMPDVDVLFKAGSSIPPLTVGNTIIESGTGADRTPSAPPSGLGFF